jgi:transcriptional regulator with XRE-family HTH domain
MSGLYDYVLQQFARTSLTYQEIADGSGVPKRTVEKVARKEIADPGVSTCDKLAAFFRAQERRAA